MREPRRADVAGQSFGRLTVTEDSEIRGRRRVYWRCVCQCGTEKWVLVDALKAGATKSCGCLNDEVRRTPIHGATLHGRHTPEYATWRSMIQRCENPKNRKWHRYGGRGVQVCEAWRSDFRTFLRDMGPRPEGMSLERQDNNLGYEPGNCKWVTSSEQNRNTSRNRFFTFQGETLCLADWVKRLGIPHATLHHRLTVWPVEKALSTPRKGIA